jgi:hypothetical protein
MPFADPEKNKAAITAWRVNNREKYNAYQAKWRSKNFFRQYGLTRVQYDGMMARQNSSCAICHTPFELEETKPCIDHDHDTGVVRGLLCRKCNLGIGYLRTPVVLEAAISYLKAQKSR